MQRAIERAGGISLAEGWPAQAGESPLAWVVEAFGRIDIALAWGEAGASPLARALSALERRAHPRWMVILQEGGERGQVEPVAPEESGRWGPPLRLTRIVRYYPGEIFGDDSAMHRLAEAAAEFWEKQ